MEDEKILRLYQQRSETAIAATGEKYGGYCHTIAYNILASYEDSDECVWDTWLRTWNAIPPAWPKSLKSFVGRITHNLAIDRYRHDQRRGGGSMAEVLEELQAGALSDPEETAEAETLRQCVTAFLRAQPREKRRLFIMRYWYMYSTMEISRKTGLKEERIRTELYRLRKKLRTHLEKEGYTI